ncbi:class I SAM-dependent methyltransferase [bacterium]|nr:class I SAM-dependent methyltransferase [bacterium]
MKERNSSWGNVAKWYDRKVKMKGHFFHENSILPRITELISNLNVETLVDLGSGQGILERTINQNIRYVGLEISPELITQARKMSRSKSPQFVLEDLGKPLRKSYEKFDVAASILALQNIENYEVFFRNASQLVKKGGHLILALNHPYYRIPRSSGWEIFPGNKKQVRWVSSYLKVQKIPIVMTPGERSHSKKQITWSFHVPLSIYITQLTKNGFIVTEMQEVASPKESVGKNAKRENIAREEIPLFMILVAKKVI